VGAVRLGGHPIHPLLVHFPIALWTGAGIAEAGGWIAGEPLWWCVSYACHALGIVMAPIAMVFGFLDYRTIGHEHPAQNTAVTHMLAMSTAWLFFVMSLGLRGLTPAATPSIWASVAAFVALAAMMIGGWHGGQLVYRYGVGQQHPRDLAAR
jgi:uncharacterized membrane protein